MSHAPCKQRPLCPVEGVTRKVGIVTDSNSHVLTLVTILDITAGGIIYVFVNMNEHEVHAYVPH